MTHLLFSYIQEKAEIFARGFLGEAKAGNLRSGAHISNEGVAPGQGGSKLPGQDEGRTGEGQEDGEPKTSEV